MTTTTRKFNRFAKGSAVYTCRICKHQTRETGDGAGVGLCELCFDIASWENVTYDSERGSAEWTHAMNQIAKLATLREARNAKSKK